MERTLRNKSFCDECESEECSASSSSQQREITITVESIEDIDYCHVKEIMTKIEFIGEVLAQSESIAVARKNVDIGLTAVIKANDLNYKFLNDLLGNPVLFTVLDCTTGAAVSSQPAVRSSSGKGEKESKKKISKPSATVTTASKSVTTATTLGVCNLDLSELIMGKRRMREILKLESDKKLELAERTNSMKRPRLVVVACSGEEKLIPDAVNKDNNIIGITVESVYNIPSYIPLGTFFDAVIPVPSFGDKTNNLVFRNGEVVGQKESDNRKKWMNLTQVDGPGGKSKHEISLNTTDIFNTISPCYDMEKTFNKLQCLIQWNMWRNCLLVKSDSTYFFSKLMKYKVWPIEIISSNKPAVHKTPKFDKKSKAPVPESTSNSNHFVAFLNLSSFLYPGVTRIRVASQLYTYSQLDLINKFGAEFPASAAQPSAPPVKSKAISERSKTSAKEPENKNTPGVLLFNEEGSPVYIIVEIELWKPFSPKREPEFLQKQLQSYLCLKSRPKKKKMNLVQAQENFYQTIKDVTSVLIKEYYSYIQLIKKGKQDNENFDKFFCDFLCRQENFQKVKNSLEDKMMTLIMEKYGGLSQYNELMPEIYVYLVEEMHRITNSYMLGQTDISADDFNTRDLQLYAEEAFEEGEYELAREYLLLKLTRDKSNPDYWLDYAEFCIKIHDYETAVQTVREVLSLDISHQMGLLLYGLLMTKVSQGTIAEITFQALLSKYPDFIEGWMALHLFYITVKSTQGEDISYQMVLKLEHEARLNSTEGSNLEASNDDDFCLKFHPNSESCEMGTPEYGMSSYVKGKTSVQPLSWTTQLCPPNNSTVKTAVLMLKLGFYGHASMALSRSLSSRGNLNHPPHYFYYQAVCYYLQDFYDEAVSQLEVHVKHYGKECSIWELMGHCFYKLKDVANAMACYEYVLESYNRPNDIHLIYLRMGSFYLKTGKYSCAKRIFMTACKYSPTPRLWIGIGIACLKLEEYEDAENAFSEANYLDNKNPETWAYLALVNVLLHKVELSKQCYAEARKRNLTNISLKQEVESCLRKHNLEFQE